MSPASRVQLSIAAKALAKNRSSPYNPRQSRGQRMQGIHDAIMRLESPDVLSSTIVRLILAAFLGGAIGLERELSHKPAGLRTNLFICFGSALFTVVSIAMAIHPED